METKAKDYLYMFHNERQRHVRGAGIFSLSHREEDLCRVIDRKHEEMIRERDLLKAELDQLRARLAALEGVVSRRTRPLSDYPE